MQGFELTTGKLQFNPWETEINRINSEIYYLLQICFRHTFQNTKAGILVFEFPSVPKGFSSIYTSLSIDDLIFFVFFNSSRMICQRRLQSTPPREKACSQKRGNVANIRSSRQGAKKLQFLSGCNF